MGARVVGRGARHARCRRGPPRWWSRRGRWRHRRPRSGGDPSGQVQRHVLSVYGLRRWRRWRSGKDEGGGLTGWLCMVFSGVLTSVPPVVAPWRTVKTPPFCSHSGGYARASKLRSVPTIQDAASTSAAYRRISCASDSAPAWRTGWRGGFHRAGREFQRPADFLLLVSPPRSAPALHARGPRAAQNACAPAGRPGGARASLTCWRTAFCGGLDQHRRPPVSRNRPRRS